jgi:hypothetical protein
MTKILLFYAICSYATLDFCFDLKVNNTLESENLMMSMKVYRSKSKLWEFT